MTTVSVAQQLETGWQASTPDGDSLCRTYIQHWIAQCELFVTAGGGVVHRDRDFVVTDLRRPSGLFNAATLTAPPADLHRTLDAVESLVDGAGEGTVHLWSLWPTPDLSERGWELEGHPPLLLRPPVDVAPVATPADPPIEVTTDADLATWEQVAIDAFPLQELQPARRGALVGAGVLTDPRIRLFLSHDDDGRPVSASGLFVSHGLATLAFAATLPEVRGRGHWGRHARHRLLCVPDLWFGGVFSDDSRPLAQAVGFVPIVRFTLWRRSRPREGAQR